MPTITVHPAAVLESLCEVASVDGSHPYSKAFGRGTDSTDYAQWYMVTGAAAQTKVFYTFDLSMIPENATITSVTCAAKCQCENSNSSRGGNNGLYLYSGDTLKTNTDGFRAFGTTATIVTVPETTWTRDELNNLRLRIFGSRGFFNTSTSYYIRFYGADLTVTYEVPEETTDLRVKQSGTWVSVKSVYKKVSGIWVEQNNLQEIFDENTKYVAKNLS